MSIIMRAQQLAPSLSRWRRHLHEFPELGTHEIATRDYLWDILRELKIEARIVGGTGLMADIGQGEPGVAIRADMDGLPIQEEVDSPYRSKHANVMHACGHDGHMAILLGVAAVLSTLGSKLPGRIRFLFQPAEEALPGGALTLIKEGALTAIDRVLGLHLEANMPVGHVGAVSGVQTANADAFTIRLEGHGGHGSAPHQAHDAIVAGAALVDAIQTIVSRSIDPLESAVVTVGTFQAGANYNIIAPRAILTGTVRTFSQESRTKVQGRLLDLTRLISQAHGVSGTLSYVEGYPSIVNSARETNVLRQVVESVLGQGAWLAVRPQMAGEDFSYYLHERPGTYFLLGARSTSVQNAPPHHHPQFTFDEEALPIGVAILAETALRFLSINTKNGKRGKAQVITG